MASEANLSTDLRGRRPYRHVLAPIQEDDEEGIPAEEEHTDQRDGISDEQ